MSLPSVMILIFPGAQYRFVQYGYIIQFGTIVRIRTRCQDKISPRLRPSPLLAGHTVTLVIHWYIFWHVFKGLYQGANCICDKTNCMPWQIITGSYSCTLDNNGKCDNSDLLQNFYPQGFRPYLYKTSNKYRPRWIQGLSKNKKQFI